MTATIHFNELAAWQKRHYTGEIFIYGMVVKHGRYMLTYEETPNNFTRVGIAEEALGVRPRTHTSPAGGSTPPPATISKPMVHCETCNTDHEEGQECKICAPMARILEMSRIKRRDYALQKRFGKVTT